MACACLHYLPPLAQNPTPQGDEDDPETGVQSSFRVGRPNAPRALTLFRLREVFPFEGKFHFRLKVCASAGGSEGFVVLVCLALARGVVATVCWQSIQTRASEGEERKASDD